MYPSHPTSLFTSPPPLLLLRPLSLSLSLSQIFAHSACLSPCPWQSNLSGTSPRERFHRGTQLNPCNPLVNSSHLPPSNRTRDSLFSSTYCKLVFWSIAPITPASYCTARADVLAFLCPGLHPLRVCLFSNFFLFLFIKTKSHSDRLLVCFKSPRMRASQEGSHCTCTALVACNVSQGTFFSLPAIDSAFVSKQSQLETSQSANNNTNNNQGVTTPDTRPGSDQTRHE